MTCRASPLTPRFLIGSVSSVKLLSFVLFVSVSASALHVALGQSTEAAEWPTMEAQQQLLLLVLYEKGEVDQRDLVKFTKVGTTSNNRNIARLGDGWKPSGKTERQPGLGWVESYRDPMDQRYTKVRLTPLGLAEMDRIALTVAKILPRRNE